MKLHITQKGLAIVLADLEREIQHVVDGGKPVDESDDMDSLLKKRRFLRKKMGLPDE